MSCSVGYSSCTFISHRIDGAAEIPIDGLTDRVAFVTGAGSGTGRATASRFANQGASVTVVDVDDNSLAEAVKEIEAPGPKCYPGLIPPAVSA